MTRTTFLIACTLALIAVAAYLAIDHKQKRDNAQIHRGLVISYSHKFAVCKRGLLSLNVAEHDAVEQCYRSN